MEDQDSFNLFRKGSKKKVWEAILKLIEGLYSLHTSGLIHRNISLDSIYFDGEAYRQGEPEILKIGDFNWSIYLHSISNLFTEGITAEIVKNNYHFFRAPECLPISIDDDFEYIGETFQSDLFSLGLVLVFLLIDFDVERFIKSDIGDRNHLFKEIKEAADEFKGYPLEREILLEMVELDLSKRFPNVGELIEKVRELVNTLKYNFMIAGQLPINFKLERTSPFLRKVANDINISIDAILMEPNGFLTYEFENNTLYLTNNSKFPLWARGKSGSYYKFRKAYRRSNLAQIQNFNPKSERELELTNIEISKVEELYWHDIHQSCSYSIWDEIFYNAASQIRERELEHSIEELKRERWLKIISIIEESEEDIEKRGISEFELIYNSSDDDSWEDKDKSKIIINVFNEENKDSFIELINEATSKYVELLDTDFLFESFKNTRMWKIIELSKESQMYITIVLEGKRRNEVPPDNGFIRLWDLRYTVSLLRRKRNIIQNIEENEHLLNAILHPASSHMYFEKYDRENLVSFIYYTNPIFLLQGPPGTGKTWTAKELIKLTLEKDPYSRILVASKEHSVLDDLLLKCVNMLEESDIKPYPNLIRLISPERELRYSPSSIPYNHFITQFTKEILKKISRWNPKEEKFKELVSEIRAISRAEIDSPSKEWIELLKESSNLIFCTSTAHDLKELEYATLTYDLVIIEEAGKAYPSELFKPMQLGNKWVLIGDQNQLPPFRLEDIIEIIEKKLDNIEQEEEGKPNFDPNDFLKFKKEVKNNVKIFQSMFNEFQNIKHSFNDGDEIKSCDTLLDQYRLPSKISKMISAIFYDKDFNQKKEDSSNFIKNPAYFRNQQVIWINLPMRREFREKREGINIYNPKEIQVISQLISKLEISDNYHPFSLAILSPYKEQVEKLKTSLPARLPNLNNINIRECCFTVDSFQGQEADLVIISLVRNNNYETSRRAWGFVPQIERLNVMLSRAREAEIIIGSWDMCNLHRGDPYMEKFIQVAKFFQNDGIVIDYDEVLK